MHQTAPMLGDTAFSENRNPNHLTVIQNIHALSNTLAEVLYSSLGKLIFH